MDGKSKNESSRLTLKDVKTVSVIPAGIAGIQSPWMARLRKSHPSRIRRNPAIHVAAPH
jgi:hypothetical protein